MAETALRRIRNVPNFQVLHSRVAFWPYPQTLYQAIKGMPLTNTLAYYEHS
jgi:hypothetical protein